MSVARDLDDITRLAGRSREKCSNITRLIQDCKKETEHERDLYRETGVPVKGGKIIFRKRLSILTLEANELINVICLSPTAGCFGLVEGCHKLLCAR